MQAKFILYISYTGMTDPLGQSQVLAYLKAISHAGEYKYTIISFEKEEPFKKLRLTIEAFCRDAGIEWHPLSYTAKPPVLSTFMDVNRMKMLALKLAKSQKFSLVHCRSYIPSLVGLHIKKKLAIPFLFDMRGFWADERIDGGIWKLSNPVFNLIYKYFKKKEIDFLQSADQIVSLTHNAKLEIERRNLIPAPAPITVIPCCADFEVFDPSKITLDHKSKVLEQLYIQNDAIVYTYLGSLGTWYMLNEMMDFAKTYQKQDPRSYFLVLTGEPEQIILDAAAKAGFNKDFLRIKKVSRAEVPAYLSISNFSIFFIKPAFSKKASSPVKQGELMAMGIPIICNDKVGDTAEIIRETKAGIVLEAFNEESYHNAIDELNAMHFDKKQIRKKAEKYFLLSSGVALYSSIYNKITFAYSDV